MEKVKPIKMRYKDIKSFEFAQVMSKLSNTSTINVRANHIRHIVKELNKAGEQISEEYKSSIIEPYAKKDKSGALVKPKGEPGGFIPDEARQDEFLKAQEEFGERFAEINWRPMTPDTLSDIKLTAKELDLLGDLFTEENGPGLPPLQLQR